jgi:heme-degrading monooxygenase HmoA
MLVRIVKMTFEENKIQDFLANFNVVKEHIIRFEGCELLELYQDRKDACVYFTYSYWKSESDLDNYRGSVFFKEVWAKTKTMFSEKPVAWSVNKMISMQHQEKPETK